MEELMKLMPVLKALDADGDGKLSAKEIENATAALKTLDKNKDGKLEGEEIQPDMSEMRGGRGGFGGRGGEGGRRGGEGGGPGGGRGGRRGEGGDAGPDAAATVERMMKLDKDDDQKLTKEEVGERLAPMIARADTDKDGFVTKAELEKAVEGFGARQRGGAGHGGRGGEAGGPGKSGGRPDSDG
jgi:Ca2+-binding EF-hand superfamily protein